MPRSSGDKLCPICDSPLEPGSRKCSFCGTDLAIFDMDTGGTEPAKQAPPPAPPKVSMEAKVREVLSAPAKPKPAPPPQPAPDLHEEPVPTAAVPMSEPPVEKVVEPEVTIAHPRVAEEKKVGAEEYFACPECGTKVEVHAGTCPGCGVMFAEEGAEMFQCPACNTLVNMDSKSCPGCGAVFVESEEDGAPEAQPVGPQVEVAEPVSEVRPEPEVPAPVRPAEPEPAQVEARPPEPAEEAEGRKGRIGFGWLKKRRKDEEQPAPEPVVREAPPQVPTPEEPRAAPEPEQTPRPQPPSWGRRPEPTRGDAKDKGKELARMVAEMKPILTLANEKDIDIAESKKLIDDAAEAGRDRQLERALELVNRSRTLLMARIDEHLASVIAQLKEETAVAKSLGGDVSRAMTYQGEVERAKAAGDPEAAYVYAEKASKELLPITGRYKEAIAKTAALKSLVTDCETLILDTKEARTALVEANKAFEINDFDRVEMLVKQATDRLNRAIPDRINEEMHAAKGQLIEAKMRNINTTPMITILKSVRTMMKAGDYQQALREMKEFKEQMRRVM